MATGSGKSTLEIGLSEGGSKLVYEISWPISQKEYPCGSNVPEDPELSKPHIIPKNTQYRCETEYQQGKYRKRFSRIVQRNCLKCAAQRGEQPPSAKVRQHDPK